MFFILFCSNCFPADVRAVPANVEVAKDDVEVLPNNADVVQDDVKVVSDDQDVVVANTEVGLVQADVKQAGFNTNIDFYLQQFTSLLIIAMSHSCL